MEGQHAPDADPVNLLDPVRFEDLCDLSESRTESNASPTQSAVGEVEGAISVAVVAGRSRKPFPL